VEAESLGWSEAEPQDDEREETQRAERARAQAMIPLDKPLSPTSWALLSTQTFLGFRFAPPQALCCRHASWAHGNSNDCLRESIDSRFPTFQIHDANILFLAV
jgi:hypothetical protein